MVALPEARPNLRIRALPRSLYLRSILYSISTLRCPSCKSSDDSSTGNLERNEEDSLPMAFTKRVQVNILPISLGSRDVQSIVPAERRTQAAMRIYQAIMHMYMRTKTAQRAWKQQQS